MIRKTVSSLLILATFLGVSACLRKTDIPKESATPVSSSTPQPATVTPTLPPLAAKVNDGYILLIDYQAELGRLKEAEGQIGKALNDAERRQMVLDELIGQEILVQEATRNGFVLDEQGLDEQIAKLRETAGGAEAFTTWMQANGYDDESFRRLYWKATAAAWQREKILAELPDAVEQVHARQILVFTQDLANKIFGQLQAGADFATLAFNYDPVTGGDLGWFPRGYLTQPDIEAAVFALQPGEYSQVIQTSFGYHLVQVVERDTARRLDADARQALQHEALQNWIQGKKEQSKIEVLTP